MTYYKYAERRVGRQMDWSVVGKEIDAELSEEKKIRENKRTQLEGSTAEFMKTLSNAPQGEYKDASQYALDYASDGTQAMQMLNKQLKSGDINIRDYTMKRQSLMDGTNGMFGLMKEYQTEYSKKMEMYNKGEIGEETLFDMSVIEGLANFTQTKAVINPNTYQVNIAELETDPETGMMKASSNPAKLQSIQSLKNRMQTAIPKFDVEKAMNIGKEALGKYIEVEKSGGILTRQDILNQPGYANAETKYINSLLVNPHDAASVLTDFAKMVDGTEEVYGFTMDEEEARRDPSKILKVPDPQNPGSGRYIPKLSETQTEAARTALRTEMRKRLDMVETPTPTFSPKAEKAETEGQAKRRAEKQRTQDFIEEIGALYHGGTGQSDVARITEYLKAYPPMPSRGQITKIDRTDGSVGITFAKTPDEVFEIKLKDDAGNPVSYKQFVKNMTTLVMGNVDFTDVEFKQDATLAQGVDATSQAKQVIPNRANASYKFGKIEVPLSDVIKEIKSYSGYVSENNLSEVEGTISDIFNTLPSDYKKDMKISKGGGKTVTLDIPSLGEKFTFKVGTGKDANKKLIEAVEAAYDKVEAKSKTKNTTNKQPVYKGVDANGKPIYQ